MEVYLSLSGLGTRRSSPQHRARSLLWRTREQREQHTRWRFSSLFSADDDQRREDGEQSEGPCRSTAAAESRYPLTSRQLNTVSRVCYAAQHEVRQLVRALEAYNRAVMAHREAFMACEDEDGNETVLEPLRLDVDGLSLLCERAARFPLRSVLLEAREELCVALGLDSSRVPGEFDSEWVGFDASRMAWAVDGDDHDHDEDDYDHDDGGPGLDGENGQVGERVNGPSATSEMSRCAFAMQMFALDLSRAVVSCGHRLHVAPGRVTGRLVRWMLLRPVEMLVRMEEDGHTASDSMRTRLQGQQVKIKELVRKMTRRRMSSAD